MSNRWRNFWKWDGGLGWSRLVRDGVAAVEKMTYEWQIVEIFSPSFLTGKKCTYSFYYAFCCTCLQSLSQDAVLQFVFMFRNFIILGLILDSSPFFFFSLFYWVFLVTLRLQIGPLNINVIILFDYEAHHKAYYTSWSLSLCERHRRSYS